MPDHDNHIVFSCVRHRLTFCASCNEVCWMCDNYTDFADGTQTMTKEQYYAIRG